MKMKDTKLLDFNIESIANYLSGFKSTFLAKPNHLSLTYIIQV